MNDSLYDLLNKVVSRESYINDWWRANPSKDCLSEDDEELLTSQLNELGNDIKKLETRINELRNLIG